jgi:hypothetical protein
MQHMVTVRAEEQLHEMTAAMLPWVEDDTRHEIIEEVQKAAGIEPGEMKDMRKIDVLSMEDFRAEIKRGING